MNAGPLNCPRRGFLCATTSALAAGLIGAPAILRADGRKARAVVVGGDDGGAIPAKYLKMEDPDIRVTLIERNPVYVSCPLSNEVL
jgi:sulfide dehydrogenase [flavocytochrome c] flavoprotein subunit